MKFSHVDKNGKAKMVDVSEKKPMKRIAKASGEINLSKVTIKLIKNNLIKKGDVLAVARVAGIQAAKETSRLIPLCHPLQLSNVSVDFEVSQKFIKATGTAKCIGQTGVEMEALTAVQIALLTIYDMCKAVDKKMTITNVKLLDKTKEEL